ncbi:MAG: hypothetical protein RLZZ447_978 [Verrucomicrobiota bacterium]|jgi:hypothetical protein
MTRNLLIFIGTFLAGALIALVARAARFAPHQGSEGHPAPSGAYAGMVSNPLAPVNPDARQAEGTNAALTTQATPGASQAGREVAPAAAANDQPVNTICAICGMNVDPKLPTMEYRGKRIGFGCKMCAPKVKADPDKYGPAYLRNEVIKH